MGAAASAEEPKRSSRSITARPSLVMDTHLANTIFDENENDPDSPRNIKRSQTHAHTPTGRESLAKNEFAYEDGEEHRMVRNQILFEHSIVF